MARPNINSISHLPPVQDSLLRNLNMGDYINANVAGIERFNIQPQLVRRSLGAGCNERIAQHNQHGVVTGFVNCPNGPQSHVRIQWCDKPLPTFHGGPMNRNVCEECIVRNGRPRMERIIQNLLLRMAIQCKRCSQRQRRLHPNPGPVGDSACDCLEHINAGWKCRGCYDDVMHIRTNAGDARSRILLRCHKVTDKRTKRKKIVYGDPTRVREACPTPNCAAVPWTIPAFHRGVIQPISHREATFMCLNCNGVIVYPVGYPFRP
ncbi:hypothetical protein MMC22_003904 [Lobaria immixta]|nr:hypothetical protein [Lobaria immixta]